MDNGVIIALLIVAVLAVLFILAVLYIKKKIQNKIIDKGADIINKTAGKYLDEETAGKVNSATNFTAGALKKGGTAGLTTAIAKKGIEKGLEVAENYKK